MARKKKVDETEKQPNSLFNPATELNDEERENFDFFRERLQELQEAREEQYGVNIETIWAEADKNYVPHRLRGKSKRTMVEDDTTGWRGSTLVNMGDNNWQSDVSQGNVFVKIQTALSILIDQNPSGVFTPAAQKFERVTALVKQLYQRNWEVAKSKQQLKLFVFNLAKYGWAIGRTYPKKLDRTVKVLTQYDPDDPEKSVWEEKKVNVYNDVFRENLDPWNAWIDDMARPNNEFSMRDWAWRKVYSMSSAKEEFGKYKNWKHVRAGGVTTDKIVGKKGVVEKKYEDSDLVEIYFYENVEKDLFVVSANSIPLIIEPLPISDSKGHKKLSCWPAYWNIRHAECPYGIGLYEAIRYDQNLVDKIRNMTIDQLVISIYKMWFYQGTQSLQETGDIKLSPGVGKQVLNPKDINWVNVPGPGAEAWKGIELFKKDLDEVSGITDPLIGEITGKTAFELAQAKEAALKRLKTPLDNILNALETEAYITISVMDLIYSVPETYEITDSQLIDDYLKEINGDPDLYERNDKGTFVAKVYPEFPLNVSGEHEKDEAGLLIESESTRFFRVKPGNLKWEGVISIKPQSILAPSEQTEKALGLEMYNLLIPLFQLPPQLYAKAAKAIIKLYGKDPKDILPDSWLVAEAAGEPLIVPAGLPQGGEGQQVGTGTIQPNDGSSSTFSAKLPGVSSVPNSSQAAVQAPKLTASPTIPEHPSGIGQKIISRLTRPFRGV